MLAALRGRDAVSIEGSSYYSKRTPFERSWAIRP